MVSLTVSLMVILSYSAVVIGAEGKSSAASAVKNIVKIVPAPQGEAVSGPWSLKVNGQPVDIYSAMSQDQGKEYYFASFDFSGTVSLEIGSAVSLKDLRIGPDRFDVKTVDKEDKKIRLKADKPFQIALEPNGLIKPLLIFGNELEKDVPVQGQKNVVYYGPGVHKTGKIVLKDNQTLYLAAGAVVKGCVQASGKNIVICGRGLLAGEDSPRFSGPGRFMLDCNHCENVTIRDITIRNPWSWTFVTWDCSGVLIDGVKICGSRMINDDALDLVNTEKAIVKNCFFRTQDDNIAIKGLAGLKRPCEDILIEDCIFWTDSANVFRIGYECETAGMRKLIARNIDVLHYSFVKNPKEYWAHSVIWLQPNQNMTMEDCHFENFRIRSDGKDMVIVLARPMSCRYGKFKNPEPGRVQNCTFKNIQVYGPQGTFKGQFYFQGDSADHSVKNFTFENITVMGRQVLQNSPEIQKNGHVENIIFR